MNKIAEQITASFQQDSDVEMVRQLSAKIKLEAKALKLTADEQLIQDKILDQQVLKMNKEESQSLYSINDLFDKDQASLENK
jgi:signal transduction histidine kinase